MYRMPIPKIHVPRGIRLRVATISADVELNDLDGEVGVRTVSGDVEGENLGARTHIKTTSGDIDLSGASGSVRVVTTSGDTELKLTASDVQVDAMSGDVDLDLASFDTVRASTVSGELAINGSMNPAGRVEGSTVSGDVRLHLTSSANAEVDCRTGPGGDIDNGLSRLQPQQGPIGSTLQATVGDGNGTIRISTVSGTIRLKPR